MDLSFIKNNAEILDTVVFEHDDMMMQGDILEVPNNIIDIYLDDTDINDSESIKPSDITMPILYIRRKTSKPHKYTRIYTNSADRFSDYVSKGFKEIYTIDKYIKILMQRGWVIGADNLTMNDFYKMWKKLFLFTT